MGKSNDGHKNIRSEENYITDNDRTYFTTIPNIVFRLGLSPHALTLYAALKQTAGADKDGKSWKTTDTLAEQCNMSAAMVSKTKRELTQKFDLLGGKPLVTIEETMVHPVSNKRKSGGRPYHIIRIVDIWRENIDHFSSSHTEVATRTSPHELETADEVHDVNFASSQCEVKKNPIEEKPLLNKNQKGEPATQGATAPPAPVKAQQKTLNGMPKRESSKRPEPVEIYRGVFGLYPNKNTWSKIQEVVSGRNDRWREVCEAWQLQQYNPRNLQGLFDWLNDGVPDFATNGGSNGRSKTPERANGQTSEEDFFAKWARVQAP